MISQRSIWIAALVVFFQATSSAIAENRIALVIGNSAYEQIGQLPNPRNDMTLIASTLEALDFEVISAADVDLDGMKDVVQHFGRRLEEAGPDTVGLFFYAGHGLQAKGANFLVPTDAAIMRETDITVETIDVNWVLDQMAFAGNRMNLVILDACRNNPIVSNTRSGTRGLAQIDAPRGTLIAYATAPGAVAVDGVGANSPYSAALARNLQVPGLSVEEVFRQTRVEVLDRTDGDQVPWESSSLTGAFYFQADDAETSKSAPAPVAAAAADRLEQAALVVTEPKAGGSAARKTKDFVHIELQDRLMVVQEYANVRAEPSTEAPIITTLDPGLEVQVTGAVIDENWYRIRLSNHQDAFIWQPLLGPDSPDVDIAALPKKPEPNPPSPPKSLSGIWTGHYRCQQDVIGVTIELVERVDNSLEGVFSFFPIEGSPSFPEGSFALAGRIDPAKLVVDLKSTSWIDRPHGHQRHDLKGEIGSDQDSMTGRILTTGCADFALERRD